jgi:hypothetical protein
MRAELGGGRSGEGELLAGYTGKMMAGSVVEENEGFSSFGQKGGEWPSVWLSVPAAKMVMGRREKK